MKCCPVQTLFSENFSSCSKPCVHHGLVHLMVIILFYHQTLAAENHSERPNNSEPEVPPAIPSRPEHTKSKVWILTLLILKSDWHLISHHNIIPESNIRVTKIKEIIVN